MVALLRKAMPYLLVAILVAAAYDGWVFYSRWRDKHATEQQEKVQEADDAKRTIDRLGGGQLKILHFYASPSPLRRGTPATMCFGVYGAKSVRIEPLSDELHPAVSHCMQVSPLKSTEYKLVAEDGAGHTATQSITLQVAP